MRIIHVPESPEDAVALAVRDFRAHCGLTQKQMAEKIGVSQPTLARTEKNGKNAPLTLLLVLSHTERDYFLARLDYYASQIT